MLFILCAVASSPIKAAVKLLGERVQEKKEEDGNDIVPLITSQSGRNGASPPLLVEGSEDTPPVVQEAWTG